MYKNIKYKLVTLIEEINNEGTVSGELDVGIWEELH